MRNTGKIFEEDFRKSVPDYCLYVRLQDPPQSFDKGGTNLRFSWKNPCDMMIFDSYHRIFYTLELKTTKSGRLGFENINDDNDQTRREIHRHQIESLMEFGRYNNVVSGFMFNFRNEETNMQKTFFQSIDDFMEMTEEIGKKSFNMTDLAEHDGREIRGRKAISRYRWFLEDFFI